MKELVVKGSLMDASQSRGVTMAEAIMEAEAIVLIDMSGSMGAQDMGGKARYEVAQEQLARLQGRMPGAVGVISFSTSPVFVPDGIPVFSAGSTNLARALEFAKVADVEGMRFIVISDGFPDSESLALDVARRYTNKIDTVFIGPADDTIGQDFLRQLAAAGGGKSVSDIRLVELARALQLLLEA